MLLNGSRYGAQITAERHDWKIVEIFKDEGISGAKGREKRPSFDKLSKAIVKKDFDIVAVWSVDRLGRSLQDLVAFLNEIQAKGIDLYLHQQGIDTTTPGGKALFQMLGVFAEFERAMIQERVKAGLNRARLKGKELGRPKVSKDIEDRILQLRCDGYGVRKIAAHLGVGVGTVKRVSDVYFSPAARSELENEILEFRAGGGVWLAVLSQRLNIDEQILQGIARQLKLKTQHNNAVVLE